jgi:hypothetical protein
MSASDASTQEAHSSFVRSCRVLWRHAVELHVPGAKHTFG